VVVARQAVVTRRVGASSCCDAGRTGGYPSRRGQACKTGSPRSRSSARTKRRANARSCLIATFRLFRAMGPSGRSRTATMGPAAHPYSLTTSLRRGGRTDGMSAGHRAVGLRDRRTRTRHEEARSRARVVGRFGFAVSCWSSQWSPSRASRRLLAAARISLGLVAASSSRSASASWRSRCLRRRSMDAKANTPHAAVEPPNAPLAPAGLHHPTSRGAPACWRYAGAPTPVRSREEPRKKRASAPPWGRSLSLDGGSERERTKRLPSLERHVRI